MSGTLEEIDLNEEEEENQQNINKGGNNQSQDNSKTISQSNDKSKDDKISDNTDLQFNHAKINMFQNDNEQNKSSENTNPVQIDQNKLIKTSNEQAAVQESQKNEEEERKSDEEEERKSDNEGMNENNESKGTTSNISNLLLNSQKHGADKSEKVKKNDGKLNAPMNNFFNNNKIKNQNAGNIDNNMSEKMIISKGPSLEEEKHDKKATLEEVHEGKKNEGDSIPQYNNDLNKLNMGKENNNGNPLLENKMNSGEESTNKNQNLNYLAPVEVTNTKEGMSPMSVEEDSNTNKAYSDKMNNNQNVAQNNDINMNNMNNLNNNQNNMKIGNASPGMSDKYKQNLAQTNNPTNSNNSEQNQTNSSPFTNEYKL